MTAPFSKKLLTEMLASLPNNIEQLLLVRDNEPHILNVLKLTIRTFFNNILRSNFINIHGNDWFKALWLLQNVNSAQRIFEQYNFLDLYPYIDENRNQITSFPINIINQSDVNYNTTIFTERIPYLLGAIETLKKVRLLIKEEILQRFELLATSEIKQNEIFQHLAVNLMFSVGEYDSGLDKFIDLFISNDDDTNEEQNKRKDRKDFPEMQNQNNSNFSERSICVLSETNEGKVLTLLPDS